MAGLGREEGERERLPSASLLHVIREWGALAIAMGLGQAHWVAVRAGQPRVMGWRTVRLGLRLRAPGWDGEVLRQSQCFLSPPEGMCAAPQPQCLLSARGCHLPYLCSLFALRYPQGQHSSRAKSRDARVKLQGKNSAKQVTNKLGCAGKTKPAPSHQERSSQQWEP